MMTEGFYLGGMIDATTRERTADLVDYPPTDLTTHGVIVGMTGSGKTGLGIIYLEEALLAGIPTLILDPKGDMTNLLLTFPNLDPTDFEPWIDPAEAKREKRSIGEIAAAKAELWRTGLAAWDQDGGRIRRLRNGADFTIYTPGSSAGVPINIIGSLTGPDLDWETQAEILRDEIQGFVSGLLGLVGVDADPITSREHILMANLIEHAWRKGSRLDLAKLLAQIQKPPLRKLGVFELDTFFPEADRLELAMKLNGLIASPAFATWTQGEDLDIDGLLFKDGRPRAAIMYLAHLSEEERQFIVTLILSRVITWMRALPGTGDLRALIYMDEVYGFAPPTAQPPAKKPILTLLKQARAYGVGLLLSTQNPVDLDYKAMSNAGTWCIGRLQTERDKARILEALQSARGDVDVTELDTTISGLGKRQFLLHNTHADTPMLFTTRWALSYLRGPLTRDQISSLTPQRAAVEPAPAEAGLPEASIGGDESTVMPAVASGIVVSYLDPAAPWAATLDIDPGGSRLVAAMAARVSLTYDDRAADLVHQEEWEAIITPLGEAPAVDAAIPVDYDDRDFIDEPPPNAAYVPPEGAIAKAAYWKTARSRLKESLYRNQKMSIFKNPGLKLYSRVGEERAAFEERCDRAAQDRADAAAAALSRKYRRKLDTLRDQVATAERRVSELEVDLQGARQDELIEGAGTVMSILLGRRSTRSITGSARNRRTTRSKEQRLRAARDRATDKSNRIQEIEAELRAELEEINDRWEGIAAEIETMEIGLEKDDIRVVEVRLAWLPIR